VDSNEPVAVISVQARILCGIPDIPALQEEEDKREQVKDPYSPGNPGQGKGDCEYPQYRDGKIFLSLENYFDRVQVRAYQPVIFRGMLPLEPVQEPDNDQVGGKEDVCNRLGVIRIRKVRRERDHRDKHQGDDIQPEHRPVDSLEMVELLVVEYPDKRKNDECQDIVEKVGEQADKEFSGRNCLIRDRRHFDAEDEQSERDREDGIGKVFDPVFTKPRGLTSNANTAHTHT
jgi:hypothetical protein